MKNVLLTFCLLWWTTAVVVAAEKQPDIAVPKKGRTVDPPLSADLPDAFTKLPVFGSIEWKTGRLPWVDEGPYAGVSGMATAVHDGQIYVVGGFIPGGDETDDQVSRRTSRWAWVFNPADGSWKRLPNAPHRREYTRGIVADDRFYLIGGGRIEKGNKPPYRVHGETALLDLSQNVPQWQAHGNLNVPRTHTSVGNVGHYLVVAGGNEYDFAEKGYSHKTIRATTEVFDLGQPNKGWQVKSPLPTVGRGWSASVVSNSQLYLFGGVTWTKSGARRVGETVRYNPQSDQWQQQSPPPLAISGWEGALYRNRFALLAGGVAQPDDNSPGDIIWSDLVWAYDCVDDRWLRVEGKLPPGAVFNDPGVVVVGETIYVLGAEGPFGSHYNYFLVGKIKPVEN